MNKKSIIASILIAFALVSCTASVDAYNKQYWDTTYTFNYAQVKMMDGSVVEGKVDSWTDFEDGDQLQVKINGDTYLTHSSNVVLVKRKG
jgi:hypothetical protein